MRYSKTWTFISDWPIKLSTKVRVPSETEILLLTGNLDKYFFPGITLHRCGSGKSVQGGSVTSASEASTFDSTWTSRTVRMTTFLTVIRKKLYVSTKNASNREIRILQKRWGKIWLLYRHPFPSGRRWINVPSCGCHWSRLLCTPTSTSFYPADGRRVVRDSWEVHAPTPRQVWVLR